MKIFESGMSQIMETCARGTVDYTFLGGAQIDMYGNMNSTQIGLDHENPKIRLSGGDSREKSGLPKGCAAPIELLPIWR